MSSSNIVRSTKSRPKRSATTRASWSWRRMPALDEHDCPWAGPARALWRPPPRSSRGRRGRGRPPPRRSFAVERPGCARRVEALAAAGRRAGARRAGRSSACPLGRSSCAAGSAGAATVGVAESSITRRLSASRWARLDAPRAVLERALDVGVERVQPLQRERLGGGEALPAGARGPVVERSRSARARAGARRRAAAGACSAIRRSPSSTCPSSAPSRLRAISAP